MSDLKDRGWIKRRAYEISKDKNVKLIAKKHQDDVETPSQLAILALRRSTMKLMWSWKFNGDDLPLRYIKHISKITFKNRLLCLFVSWEGVGGEGGVNHTFISIMDKNRTKTSIIKQATQAKTSKINIYQLKQTQ